MAPTAFAPVEWARERAGESVRAFLGGRRPPPSGAFATTADDTGLFGPDSATWQLHRDRSMIVGGVRGLFLQTLHPLAMAGVAEHSDYRHDPLGRLHRTGWFLAATTFGTTETATEAIESVRAVHDRVSGTAPDGRPYSANDPDLLAWVHACEVDSFVVAHRRYGERDLGADVYDSYVAEMGEVARRLGANALPASVTELRDYFADVRPELAAGRQARETVRFLLLPPLPLVSRGAYGVLVSGAVSLLPGWVRRALWIPSVPGVEPLVVRPATSVLLRGLGWVMSPSRVSERSEPAA